MPKPLCLLTTILILPLLSLSQTRKYPQPATFALHFTYLDFKTAANIRATSLSETIRQKKFARIKDMSPGIALNYIKGLTPTFDLSSTLAGSFPDYPFPDSTSSGTKNLLLEADVSIRGKMFTNEYWLCPYLQVGTGISKYKGYWGAFIPVGVGIQLNPTSELHVLVNAQYRVPVTESTVSHHFFYSIGIAGIIGKKIIPKKPAPPVISQSLQYATDRDHDGIPDTADACPDVPGQVRFKGCPDRDEDGIQDLLDSCPQVPGLPRYNGCPVPDRDGDGINDEEDKCIEVPGLVKYEGCPPPDRDKDGVEDENDKCPDLYGVKENSGCPEIKEEIKTRVRTAAKNIFFATGSYRLLPASYTSLNEVAQLLKDDPALLLSIEGHTDNSGTAEKNMSLSQARSEAVYNYLLKSGIDASRMKATGYGEEKPVAENTTANGRAKNRRVEFLLSY